MLYYGLMDAYSALAEPTRRNILELLANSGQMTATEICTKFQVSPPAISQHLKVLREAKLVAMEKRAQQRIYTINTQSMIGMDDWLKKIIQQWEERYTRLDALLEEEKRKLKS